VSHPGRNRRAQTAAAPNLHGDVTAALQTLGVGVTPEALDAALSAAEKESLSHLEFLHRLLAGPVEAKLQRALERRIRAAQFRERTTLEGFDWEFNARGVDRRSIEQLATCDFVRRHENVIMVGQTGLGKSRIIQSVGMVACVQGHHVRYSTSAHLLQEFTAALADGTLTRVLGEYARFDLLLIDEFGFERLEREVEGRASTFYYRLLRCPQRPAFDSAGDERRLHQVGRVPRRCNLSRCIHRPLGRRRRDPEVDRPFIPRRARPTHARDRSDRRDVITMLVH